MDILVFEPKYPLGRALKLNQFYKYTCVLPFLDLENG